MQTKTCTKCGEEKPLTEFYNDKAGKYGVKSRCKVCVRIRMQEYDSRPEVLERKRNHQREYQRRPEIREKKREYMSEYIKHPYVLDRKREREREAKRKLRAMGVLPNQYFEIAKKYATRSGRWSDAEIEFLMSSELPLVDIALELGRTYSSVQQKRHEMRKKLEAQ